MTSLLVTVGSQHARQRRALRTERLAWQRSHHQAVAQASLALHFHGGAAALTAAPKLVLVAQGRTAQGRTERDRLRARFGAGPGCGLDNDPGLGGDLGGGVGERLAADVSERFGYEGVHRGACVAHRA